MDWTALAQILDALAWPVALAAIVVALRKPLGKLAESLGGRVTALGIGTFSIELAAAKARPFSVDWEIGDSDARKLTSSTIFDSASADLFEQIARSRPADFSIIDLENGESWLASRLFIFAVILGELRGARAFVFVESKGYQRQVYVGHATLDVVRDVLGRAFPWFEVALNMATAPPPTAAIAALERPEILSLDTQGLQRLANIVQSFVGNLQRPPDPAHAYADAEWLEFTDKAGAVRFERTEWLTAARLQRLFGPHLEREFFADDPEKTETERAASVVARTGDFVAAVDAQERFQGLIDRKTLVEKLSAQVAQTLRGKG